jgi:hypothetical protein
MPRRRALMEPFTPEELRTTSPWCASWREYVDRFIDDGRADPRPDAGRCR